MNATPPPRAAVVDPLCAPWESHPDGRVRLGVLFIHGFTGCPASLRPWAERTAATGYAVSLPRLAGHGTSWQEMTVTRWPDWYAGVERAYDRLQERCERVAVAGLSMGGALALRLAEHRDVAGTVLVNPAIATTDPRFKVLGILQHVLRSTPAIGGDIAKPGQDERSYPRTPLAPAHSMTRLWADVRGNLDQVAAPVLLFTSRTDHVVDPSSAAIITGRIPTTDHRMLEDSYHVATLDHDADRIATETLEFLARL